MKCSFFQAAIVSIQLYGCTTWTLTKRMEKKLDGNYTRMLRAILNKSWRQHPTKQQLYGHLPRKLSKLDESNMRDTAGEVGTSSWVMYSCGPLHMDEQRQDVQLEPTYSSSVQIRDEAQRIGRKQWTMGRCGERGSGISVLIARHDDNDDDDIVPIHIPSYGLNNTTTFFNKDGFDIKERTKDDMLLKPKKQTKPNQTNDLVFLSVNT